VCGALIAGNVERPGVIGWQIEAVAMNDASLKAGWQNSMQLDHDAHFAVRSLH